MKKKAYNKLRKRLVALSEEWCRPLGLGWWKIQLSYDRTGETFKDAMHIEDGFRSGSAARCYPDWRYSMATIIFNMPELEHFKDNDLEMLFVHELMHIFLHEMREGANERKQLPHEERVATTLAKAFVWQREHLESNFAERQSRASNNGEDIKQVNVTVMARADVDATRSTGSDARLQGELH